MRKFILSAIVFSLSFTSINASGMEEIVVTGTKIKCAGTCVSPDSFSRSRGVQIDLLDIIDDVIGEGGLNESERRACANAVVDEINSELGSSTTPTLNISYLGMDTFRLANGTGTVTIYSDGTTIASSFGLESIHITAHCEEENAAL